MKVPEGIQAQIDATRAWERAATEWLGLDPGAAFKIDDNLGTLARPKPETEPLMLNVSMFASNAMPSEPSRGLFRGWDIHSDGETQTFIAKVALDWDDEREFMDQVGPRPAFMSLEQEPMLRGLSAD